MFRCNFILLGVVRRMLVDFGDVWVLDFGSGCLLLLVCHGFGRCLGFWMLIWVLDFGGDVGMPGRVICLI